MSPRHAGRSFHALAVMQAVVADPARAHKKQGILHMATVVVHQRGATAPDGTLPATPGTAPGSADPVMEPTAATADGASLDPITAPPRGLRGGL